MRPSVSRSLGSWRAWVALLPRAPAPGAAGQDVRVVEQPIEQRRDGGGVAEELAPVFHGAMSVANTKGRWMLPRAGWRRRMGRTLT